MKKKIFLALFLITIIAIIVFITKVIPQLEIISGYSARIACTALYHSDRDLESIQKEDLSNSLLSLGTIAVNKNEKSITSSVYGFAKKTAYYNGCGCNYNPAFKCSQSTSTKSNRDTIWPYGNEILDTTLSNVNYEKLNVAIENAFEDTFSLNGKNTRALLVIYKDQIIGEKYAKGFDKETPQLGWSMTKSITSSLIGILAKEGKLKISAPAPIAEWQEDERKNITIDNLLRMNTGLQWSEEYEDMSDVVQMLFKEDDKASYALNKPAEFSPGDHWEYSSGTTNILSKIIRQTLVSEEAYKRFANSALFDKIGMSSAIIEYDKTGHFIGSSYGYATPRDWARFGLLYLHDGMWNGNRILPEGWVDYTRKPTPNSKGEYGAQFWLNTDQKYMPNSPADLYYCSGYQKQRVFILPSQDMVIVRLGINEEFDLDGMVSGIVDAVDFN